MGSRANALSLHEGGQQHPDVMCTQKWPSARPLIGPCSWYTLLASGDPRNGQCLTQPGLDESAPAPNRRQGLAEDLISPVPLLIPEQIVSKVLLQLDSGERDGRCANKLPLRVWKAALLVWFEAGHQSGHQEVANPDGKVLVPAFPLRKKLRDVDGGLQACGVFASDLATVVGSMGQ